MKDLRRNSLFLLLPAALAFTALVLSNSFWPTAAKPGNTASSPTNIPPDSLIKGSRPTIYYYAADGQRYVFPNDKTFGSWFSDFGQVLSISDEVLGEISLKGNITYRPGVRLVKIETSPKVYAVDQGGKLRWIKTEKLAEEIYGKDWNKLIDDVPDVFFANYQEGEVVEAGDDYKPEEVTSRAITINKDKEIKESNIALRATTKVGSSTIPAIRAIPAKPPSLKGEQATPAVPAIPAEPGRRATTSTIEVPAAPMATSTPASATSTPAIPATPAVPAITATPPSTTATSTVPATPAVPAVPAFPAQPTITPSPPTTTPTSGVLKVLYPNGGEKWYKGNTYTITWQNPLSAGFAGDKNLGWGLSARRTGDGWAMTIAAGPQNLQFTQSSYTWTVPNSFFTGSDFKIQLTLFKTCAFSDAPCPEPSSIFPNQVRSNGETGATSDGVFSILVAPVDTTAPSVPTYFEIAGRSSTRIDLSWNMSTDNVGVAGYKIYRNGIFLTDVVSKPLPLYLPYYSDSGLSPATTFTYTIAAYDAAGNVSNQTAPVLATTLALSSSPQTTPPAVADITPPTISNIQAIYITENSATITWTTDELSSSDVNYAASSLITATSTVKVTGVDNTTNHSVNISNLSVSKTYYFAVISKDADGNTATSTEQSFTTLTPPSPPPPIPTPTSLPSATCESETRLTSTETAGRLGPRISGDLIVWQESPTSFISHDIYLYTISTAAQRQITATTAHEFKPAISGNRIVYGFFNNDSTIKGIKLYDLTTNSEQVIAQGATSRSIDRAVIDGDKIVYEADNNIYLYDLATNQEKQLGTSSYRPSISGDDVVWEHHPDNAVYHYKISTNVTRSIPSVGQQRVGPKVSNGTVVYQSYYGSNNKWDMFTYDLNTNIEKKRIAVGPTHSQGFSISGNKVVWQEGYNLSAVNYLYDLNTGTKTVITTAESYKSAPWISGNKVVWTDSRYRTTQLGDIFCTSVP